MRSGWFHQQHCLGRTLCIGDSIVISSSDNAIACYDQPFPVNELLEHNSRLDAFTHTLPFPRFHFLKMHSIERFDRRLMSLINMIYELKPTHSRRLMHIQVYSTRRVNALFTASHEHCFNLWSIWNFAFGRNTIPAWKLAHSSIFEMESVRDGNVNIESHQSQCAIRYPPFHVTHRSITGVSACWFNRTNDTDVFGIPSVSSLNQILYQFGCEGVEVDGGGWWRMVEDEEGWGRLHVSPSHN